MLTEEQKAARQGKLTASAVAALTKGSKTEIHNLWLELVGDPSFKRPDLSGVWPVALGSETEQLNLDWYERKTGALVTRRGEVTVMDDNPWAAATLDGWDSAIGCCIECKHVGGNESLSTVIARYQPQMHWQMIVTNTTLVMMSVIEAAREPIREKITYDDAYGAELWRRAKWFMNHVETLTPPVQLDPVAPPVKATVTYDFKGNNEWADSAVTWLEHAPSKKKADKAEKALKELIPADAERAHGHGVVITRDRAGRMSLKKDKGD